MHSGARRLSLRKWGCQARRVLLLLCLWPAGAMAADVIKSAAFEDPTTRYPHAVLGDAIEHETLAITLNSGEVRRFTLPITAVFEDTSPRLVDLDGDGSPEVITVESNASQGARLVVYSASGRIASTPYIGTRFRWLAPLGAADLDGDGMVELAYVDRPHLAKTLRIWRYDAGTLTEAAAVSGVTNHRIGETDIAGGIRQCDGSPEMVLATASWDKLVALEFHGGQVTQRTLTNDTSRAAFAKAMNCDL